MRSTLYIPSVAKQSRNELELGDEIDLSFTGLTDAIDPFDELQNDVGVVRDVEEKHRAANFLQIDRTRRDPNRRHHDLTRIIEVVENIHR